MGVITKSKVRSNNRNSKSKKPIKRIDELEDLFRRMNLRRDYSIYEKTLNHMISLERLSMARNQFDCVIQSMYCVGLLEYDRANDLALKIDIEGHRGIVIETIVEFLTENLNGVVSTYEFQEPPFNNFDRLHIFNEGESTLLGYTRRDNTAHMVVLGKYRDKLYIYDKQADRRFRIDAFLLHEPTIIRYTLFKIILKQDKPKLFFGMPIEELPPAMLKQVQP